MEERIKKCLHTNARVVYAPSMTSTSDTARERILSDHSRLLVVADEQTAGRGRRGRSFYSPLSGGLYMTVAFPVSGRDETVFLTCAAAVAVCRVLERKTGISVGIKWVNDLILNGKKVGGILTEYTGNAVLIGVGLNLTTEHFPKELSSVAGSLHTNADRAELCAALADELFCLDRDVLPEYKKRSVLLQKDIRFERNGTVREGKVLDIATNGGLVVETAEGVETLSSGEITVREQKK